MVRRAEKRRMEKRSYGRKQAWKAATEAAGASRVRIQSGPIWSGHLQCDLGKNLGCLRGVLSHFHSISSHSQLPSLRNGRWTPFGIRYSVPSGTHRNVFVREWRQMTSVISSSADRKGLEGGNEVNVSNNLTSPGFEIPLPGHSKAHLGDLPTDALQPSLTPTRRNLASESPDRRRRIACASLPAPNH